MQSTAGKMGPLSWGESGMCRWQLGPRPALGEVTPALLCHEGPLSRLTMLIQPQSFHAYVTSEIPPPACIRVPDSPISEVTVAQRTAFFVYRARLKSGPCSRSVITSWGLMCFPCVVSEIAKTLGLVRSSCVFARHNALEITQAFLINAPMHL